MSLAQFLLRTEVKAQLSLCGCACVHMCMCVLRVTWTFGHIKQNHSVQCLITRKKIQECSHYQPCVSVCECVSVCVLWMSANAEMRVESPCLRGHKDSWLTSLCLCYPLFIPNHPNQSTSLLSYTSISLPLLPFLLSLSSAPFSQSSLLSPLPYFLQVFLLGGVRILMTPSVISYFKA